MTTTQDTHIKFNNLDSVLKVNNLTKTYGDLVAVDQLTFSIQPGEIYGLLGPNGAGKSTTIKSILGLISTQGGEISVLGKNPTHHEQAIKKQVGYVSEEPLLYESMTVKELFDFIGSIRQLDTDRASALAEEYLESFDALQYYNSLIGTLSRGNKQKIQIIASLLHEPPLMILDEPLSGLDAKSAHVYKEILQMHVRKGGAILMSTHVMEQAQNMCNRIGIINQGRMVAEGTFDELQTAAHSQGESLEDVFLKLTKQDTSVETIIKNLQQLTLEG